MRNVGFFILLFVFGSIFIAALFEALFKFRNHVSSTPDVHELNNTILTDYNETFSSSVQNQGVDDTGYFTSTTIQQEFKLNSLNVRKVSMSTSAPTENEERNQKRTGSRTTIQTKAVSNVFCNESSLQEVSGTINSPQEYPTEEACYTWSIDVGEGYSLNITITTLDLDGSTGDYLIISPSEAELSEDTNPLFTWNLDRPRQVHIVEQGTAFIKFQTFTKNSTQSPYTGFQIEFLQYGNVTDDTNSTTEAPIPSSDVDSTITIYVALNTTTNVLEQFYQNIDEFRTAVAEMAALYCSETGITLTVDPSYQNVVIYSVMPCLLTWPDSNSCLQIKMAVPVNNTNSSVYELNQLHLEEMWNTYSSESLASSGIGFKVYEVPDGSNIIIWIAVSAVIVIVFSAALMIIWKINIFKEDDRDSRALEDEDLQQTAEDTVYVSVPESFPGEKFDPEITEIPVHNKMSYTAEINRFSAPSDSLSQHPSEAPTIPHYGSPTFGAALRLLKIDNTVSEDDEAQYERIPGASENADGSKKISYEHVYDDPQLNLPDVPRHSIYL